MSLRRVAVLGVGSWVLYDALLRRPILTWGATAAEAEERLPGDELLEDADGVSTRERKMLLGIKQRAERLSARPAPVPPAA
jgi:hypothetical protein